MGKSEDLAKALMGAGVMNDERQEVSVWLDTGFPPLNKAISGSYDGGMPCGRIVEMYGPESSGKTAIATKVMIAAQQAGGVAMFHDHERSFDLGIAVEMGLDDTFGPWIFRTPDTLEQSVTDAINAAQTIRDSGAIAPEAPIVVVFDSLAAMVPQEKFQKGLTELNMRDKLALAAATAATFPSIALWAEKLNMLCLFLNQERDSLDQYKPANAPGGRAPKFYASVRIALKREMIKVEGKKRGEKETIGQIIKCDVIKNKVSAPFKKAAWRFMFRDDGTGYFDVATSLVEYMVEEGILPRSGNWIEFDGGKINGMAALVKKVEEEGLLDKLISMLPQ